MTIDEEYVKKKLKKMKEKFPHMDTDKIEKELYPLEGDDTHVKVGKKKEEEDD